MKYATRSTTGLIVWFSGIASRRDRVGSQWKRIRKPVCRTLLLALTYPYDFSRHRVKALELNIADLEAETARLLRALDAQKEATASIELVSRKRSEEIAKDLAAKVSVAREIYLLSMLK